MRSRRVSSTMAVPVRTRSRRHSEQGYILLTLMLFVTLLVIAAAAAAPSIFLQVKRDREEELIHRGVQYSRAIRRFVKKTGGYPVRLEQLDNTNNVHYLRKRYKDPLTGKDFKILRQGDVRTSFGPGISGATPVGGNSPFGASPLGGGPAAGGLGAAPGGLGAASGGLATAAASPAVTDAQAQDANQPGSNGQSQSISSQGATDTGDKLSATVFGGGPIVGVASTSKDKTIREFNKKNHYNEWQFIYDPTTDRGGLLSTPNQPPLQGAIPNLQQGAPGATGTGFGSGNGGLGSNNGAFGSPGMIPQQNQPPTQPPPQQQ
jgi:type II secretory pathway pseudopilin PulG